MIDRPSHDDFWLISQVLIDNDTAMDEATDKQTTFRSTVTAVVDLESATYAAEQRVLRAFGQLVDPRLRAAVTALWMDGFVAGAEYQKLKVQKEDP